MKNIVTYTGTVETLCALGNTRSGNTRYAFRLTTAEGEQVQFRSKGDSGYTIPLRNASGRNQVVTVGIGTHYGNATMEWCQRNDYNRAKAEA